MVLLGTSKLWHEISLLSSSTLLRKWKGVGGCSGGRYIDTRYTRRGPGVSSQESILPLMHGLDLTDEDRDFYRWYGPWAPLTPTEVAERLRGMDARWWIVGGWAVEAFTGIAREHEDVDVAFFREDLGRIHAHLSP